MRPMHKDGSDGTHQDVGITIADVEVVTAFFR